MELTDPNGVVIATEAGRLVYDAIETGIYQLHVYAESSLGEYFVYSNPGPVVPNFIDFGPADSPVFEDFTGVALEAYSPNTGYGWTQSVALNVFELNRGSDLSRDLAVMREGSFVVDVENGTYDVTVHFGVVRRRTNLLISIEGVDDIYSPTLGPNSTKVYQTTVTDGQLSFDFSGSEALDRRFRIAGISIEESQSNLFKAWNPVKNSFAAKSSISAEQTSDFEIDRLAITGLAGSINPEDPAQLDTSLENPNEQNVDEIFEMFDDFSMAF